MASNELTRQSHNLIEDSIKSEKEILLLSRRDFLRAVQGRIFGAASTAVGGTAEVFALADRNLAVAILGGIAIFGGMIIAKRNNVADKLDDYTEGVETIAGLELVDKQPSA
jgi:hypothetical protein